MIGKACNKNINKKRMRKSTKIMITIISLLLLAYSLVALINNLLISSNVNNKKEIYSYTNKFNYNYKVNLLPNKFTDSTELGMNESAYVTELIDYIDLNINYSYLADAKSNIDCKYSVTSKLVGVYTHNGEEQNIWNKEYTLLEERQLQEVNDKINIAEELRLDLKEQNELVNDFEQKMSMSIEAKYIITLNVITNTTVSNDKIKNNYSTSIAVDLGSKTTKITGDNNKEEKQFVTKNIVVEKTTNKTEIMLGVVALIIAIILFRKLSESETTKFVRNEYRLELNKILRICQDKIVQVSGGIDVSHTNVIDVKDFGEIVKLSEELFKPILYWSSKDEDESWFCVVSNNVTYRYILKR